MPAPDYTQITFQRLPEVSPDALIALMNDPDVRRHLPLARGHFGVSDCERFVAAKEQMWKEAGYGPWAFVLEGELVGWGGLQPEGDDADVGMVLHRAHWGAGRVLYERILDYAFRELGLESVIALLPTSRTRVAALRRLGFREDGQALIGEEPFNRYRLLRRDRRR
ncbi:MAG: GNAT family N-acetyltransferase [Acidobacteriota bacterium]|nr:GNAT family N-acetyltransferase [Acidobacteriota bacterium]